MSGYGAGEVGGDHGVYSDSQNSTATLRPMSIFDLLPGLLVAAWAVVLFGVLERWYDGLPRRVAAGLLVLVLVLFGQVLFGGKILLPVDNLRSTVPFQNLPAAPTPGNHLQTEQITLIAPLAAAVRSDLADGRWPLWNDHGGAGLPLLASPQAATLSPFRLATLALPLERAVGAAAALKVLIALVFGWLWIRRAGASNGAATVGALAYGLGGFVLLWLGWPRSGAAALLPVLFYAIERAVSASANRRRDVLLLIGAGAGLALAGDGEVALWGGLAALGLVAIRLARQPTRQRPALWLRTAGALALGLLLAAPVLLPQGEWSRQSSESERAMERARSERRNDPFALETMADPEKRAAAWAGTAARLPPLIAASSFTEHRTALYPGPIHRNEDAAGFAGTVTLLLALLALILPSLRAARNKKAQRLTIGRAFPAAITLGALVVLLNPPGLSYLLGSLPLVGPSAVSHRRVAVLLTLGLAALAAFAVDRLGTLERKQIRPILLYLGAVFATAIALAAPAGLPWLQLGTLAAGLIALLVVPLRWRAPCLAVLIGAELLWLHVPANAPMPRDLYFPTPPVLAALQQATVEHPDGRLAAPRGVMLPRIASVYGLSDVRPGRVAPTLYAGLTDFLGRPPDAGRPALIDDPRLDLLGIRWWLTGPNAVGSILSGSDLSGSDLSGSDLSGSDLSGSDLSGSARLLYEDATARLWERPRPLERLFLPEGVEIHREGRWEDRMGELDPRKTALLRAAVTSTPWRTTHPAASRLSLDPPEEDSLSAEAALAEPRLIASSLYQDGGWRLLVNGQAHPTFLANGPLLAAWLPTGQHRLQLLYRPRSFVHGAAGAGLALVVMVLWVAAPGLRIRPPSAGAASATAPRRAPTAP
ncbi:MAG: pentapeptide repeat-containing protein [Acidobacteriota bacterium]